MHIRRYATHVEVLAPAKINLFLQVLARRADGFHDIETVMAPLTVYDSVHFTPTPEPRIELECRWAQGTTARDQNSAAIDPARELLTAQIPLGPENLAWRAADWLRQRSGCTFGAKICLIKRIPAAAGLGGASSDAAAVFLAGTAAWQLGYSQEELLEMAAELGSDVPFFLMRGAALATGRGEKLAPIKSARLHAVVVRPPVGLSTAKVYAGCKPSVGPTDVQRLLKPLQVGDIVQAAANLTNELMPAAKQLTPWIDRLEEKFQRLPVLGHQMTGSGSSYFAICHSSRQARRLSASLRAQSLGWVAPAATMNSN